MEGFITVLVWVIVAISVIARQVKRAREASPHDAEPSTGKKGGGLLEELKRQLKEMVEENTPSTTLPGTPRPVVLPKKSQPAPQKAAAEQSRFKRQTRLDSINERAQVSRAAAAYRQSVGAEERPFNAYDHEHHEESQFEAPTLSADTLRDAVILSEILGKPRALRGFSE
jgi:hypothetical protein